MDNFDIDKRSPFYDEYYSVENMTRRQKRIEEYERMKDLTDEELEEEYRKSKE